MKNRCFGKKIQILIFVTESGLEQKAARVSVVCCAWANVALKSVCYFFHFCPAILSEFCSIDD